MTTRIRLRRASYGNWDSDDPVLDHGEIGLIYDEVDDTETIVGWVVGNGADAWGSLPINRPPTAGTRTGLDDGDGVEGDGKAPVSYDDIALLALDNTFAGDTTFNGQIAVIADEPATQDSLTVYGSLKVRESDTDLDDGNVTVENGDVTLEDGELTIPLWDDVGDTHHLRGAAGTTGCIAFAANGPFLGNSGEVGKVIKDGELGPYIAATELTIAVGGTVDADGETPTPIKYADQPEDATLVGLSSDLMVPTRKQIVDYVEEYVAAAPSPTDFEASYDPASPGLGTEVAVGKWIDGGTLYQRTIELQSTAGGGSTIITISGMDVLTEVIPHLIKLGLGDGQVGWQEQRYNVLNGTHLHLLGIYQSGTNVLNGSSKSSDTYDTSASLYSGSILTLRYTKS